MSISSFFKNTLGAKLNNSRWSWGASNPTRNQLFLRVWEDHLAKVDGMECVSILRKNWEGSSAGYSERKGHVQALQEGAEGYGVLCTAKDAAKPVSRTIAEFDDEFLLKFGRIIDKRNHVYAQVVDRIPIEQLARQQTSYSSVVTDLSAILAKRGDTTSKESLATARVGQGMFRSQVLEIWGSQCCVTGSKTLDVIRASHIKPWRDSTNEERLDPCNGLPLIATLDALFDAGLITFSPKGELLASNRLNNLERKLLGLKGLQLTRQPSDRTSKYLDYHRESIFVFV